MQRSLISLSVLLVLLCGCQSVEPPVVPDDGRPSWLPAEGFQWTRAEDVSTYHDFMRNFGVGYSYDAVRGSYCDWNDIRCQVVNRAELERVQDWIHERLVVSAEYNTISTASKFNYSKRDYIANVELDLKQKVNLGLYHKEKRQRQYFIEDGIEETFYYSLDEDITMVDAYIADGSVLALYEYGYENLLTLSFVNAVRHLDETPATMIAPVDSFLNVYGTHVIVEAALGARLRVDLENYMWMYKDNVKEGAWTGKEFIDAVAGKDPNYREKDEYNWIREIADNMRKEKGYRISVRQAGKSLEIVTEGKSAHGARPYLGQNAIPILMELLGKLNFANDDYNDFISFFNEHIGYEINGESLGVGLEDEVSGKLTLNVGTINLEKDSITVNVDIRYPVTAKAGQVYSGMEDVLNKYNLGIIKIAHNRPIYKPADDPLITTLMDIYRKYFERDDEPLVIGGGTYARAVNNIVAFGPGLPGSREVGHQKNEFIEIDELMTMAKAYTEAIYELSKGDE